MVSTEGGCFREVRRLAVGWAFWGLALALVLALVWALVFCPRPLFGLVVAVFMCSGGILCCTVVYER